VVPQIKLNLLGIAPTLTNNKASFQTPSLTTVSLAGRLNPITGAANFRSASMIKQQAGDNSS
jgi:hypothetical protein